MEKVIQRINHTDKEGPYVCLFLAFSIIAVGLFYEWTAGLTSLVLIVSQVKLRKQSPDKKQTPISLPMLFMSLIILFYGASALWAVDKGVAAFGFIKFSPLPLFALHISSLSRERRTGMLKVVPVAGVMMTVVSFLGRFVPKIGGFFTVSGRLAGFFQYPNTFALFLLLGIVCLGLGKLSPRAIFTIAVLTFGIFQSGSRAVLFLLVFVWIVLCLLHPEKKGRIKLAVLGMIGLLAMLLVILWGRTDSASRVLSNPLETSTFLGRLLYWKDALPVILRHPLGLGYQGYRYLQGSFQTGVYSVQFVHNELLQLLLDVGWLPTLALIATVVKSFFSSQVSLTQKLVLAVLCAHSLFDFDLQFVALGFVGLLCMDYEPIWGKKWRISNPVLYTGATVLASFTLYFTVVHFLGFLHLDQAALAVYPAYTEARIHQLPEAQISEEMEEIADQILRTNKSVSLAWSAKARATFAAGNFAEMIEDKEKAINLSKYELEEYLDYFDMLYAGAQLYAQAGDEGSARVCIDKLKVIPGMLEKVLAQSDPLAWEIDEKPELELPEEYRQIMAGLP